ncbi:MAG TPA: serine/threonine-protein kinase, partial [Kofleriaceae bacterium]
MKLFQRHRATKEIGAYTLGERLGHGGMGEVWSAKHKELLRPAAIKLMAPEIDAPRESRATLKKRFDREVHATAQLTSPHTVAIYDFGKTDDGGLYYVMELLQGLDMEHLVGTFGPQPADRVAYFLAQVCESLEEAHYRGLVHRDIKPANLYVSAVGMKLDFVKVLDFGLVRDMAHDLHLTADQVVSGTPAYMAPESAARHQFDARSDLYALGCVAYWLLTGRTVFEAATNAAMIAAHMYEKVTPLSRLTELP